MSKAKIPRPTAVKVANYRVGPVVLILTTFICMRAFDSTKMICLYALAQPEVMGFTLRMSFQHGIVLI